MLWNSRFSFIGLVATKRTQTNSSSHYKWIGLAALGGTIGGVVMLSKNSSVGEEEEEITALHGYNWLVSL